MRGVNEQHWKKYNAVLHQMKNVWGRFLFFPEIDTNVKKAVYWICVFFKKKCEQAYNTFA